MHVIGRKIGAIPSLAQGRGSPRVELGWIGRPVFDVGTPVALAPTLIGVVAVP